MHSNTIRLQFWYLCRYYTRHLSDYRGEFDYNERPISVTGNYLIYAKASY